MFMGSLDSLPLLRKGRSGRLTGRTGPVKKEKEGWRPVIWVLPGKAHPVFPAWNREKR